MHRLAATTLLLLILGTAAACASDAPASGTQTTGDPTGTPYVYIVDGSGVRSRVPYVNPSDGQPLSLAKLIALRGGIAPTEDASRMRVTRMRAEGRTQVAVDFNGILDGRRPDFLLRPDDVISIPAKR